MFIFVYIKLLTVLVKLRIFVKLLTQRGLQIVKITKNKRAGGNVKRFISVIKNIENHGPFIGCGSAETFKNGSDSTL